MELVASYDSGGRFGHCARVAGVLLIRCIRKFPEVSHTLAATVEQAFAAFADAPYYHPHTRKELNQIFDELEDSKRHQRLRPVSTWDSE
jgi:hypothetical protein